MNKRKIALIKIFKYIKSEIEDCGGKFDEMKTMGAVTSTLQREEKFNNLSNIIDVLSSPGVIQFHPTDSLDLEKMKKRLSDRKTKMLSLLTEAREAFEKLEAKAKKEEIKEIEQEVKEEVKEMKGRIVDEKAAQKEREGLEKEYGEYFKKGFDGVDITRTLSVASSAREDNILRHVIPEKREEFKEVIKKVDTQILSRAGAGRCVTCGRVIVKSIHSQGDKCLHNRSKASQGG